LAGTSAVGGDEQGKQNPVRAGTIEALRELWSRDRRARGGWWALAGFSFQAAVYLQRLFEGLGEGRTLPDQLAKTELLSDIFTPKDGVYTLIQAKRTLDRPRMAAALREAYEISRLCEPSLLQRVRFRISCIACTTPARPHDFLPEEVGVEDGDADAWRRFMACFDKDTAVVEEPDPIGHLYDFLWRAGVRDPAGFADHCMGVLLRMFGSPSQEVIDQVAWDLNTAFQAARSAGAPQEGYPGRVVRSRDLDVDPGDLANDRNILFDRRPQLKDLQLGRLRRRDELFSTLLKDFDAWWRTAKLADDEGRIPLFWIEGRSGEGKSVLLLQLMEHFLRTNPAPVLTQLNSPDELPRWIEMQRAIEGDRPSPSRLPAIAVVDDLHFLKNREAWEAALEAATNFASPRVVVLACGPSLERRKFAADFSTFFDSHEFHVPNLSLAEMRVFAAWFSERTGKKVEFVDTDAGNRMLVIWMFELLRGESIHEFARNFKKRLESLGLLDFARSILAANALELVAPTRLHDGLADSQRDAFEVLCSESQLHFERADEADGGFSGYRCSHPQISWHLYVEWAGASPTLAQRWGRDLAPSLIASVKDMEVSQAAQVIYGLRTSSKISEAARDGAHPDAGEIGQSFCELYRKYCLELTQEERLPHFARWLDIIQWRPLLKLSPNPVQEALQSVASTKSPGTLPAAIAGRLWRLSELDAFLDRKDELRRAAKAILFDDPDRPGVGSSLGFIAGSGTDRTAAQQLCRSWLDENPTSPEGATVLIALVAGGTADEDIVRMASLWIEGNPTHPHGYQLFSPLVAGRPADDDVARMASEWIEGNSAHPNAYQLLAPMVSARPTDDVVARMASNWIEDNLNHPQVYWLFATLIASRPTDDEAADLAFRWLADNATHTKAYHVLSPLVAGRPADDAAARVAGKWIKDNPTHPHAYQLLSTLVAGRPTDSDVARMASEWIENNPDHPHIYALLTTLITRSDGAEVWMQRGEEALLVASDGARRSLLAALVVAGKAHSRHLNRILEAIEAETDPGNRIFLKRAISRAFANNIQNAHEYFAGPASVERKAFVADAMAYGLRQYGNRAAEFVEQFDSAPPEHAGLLLSACVQSTMADDALSGVLRRWLNDHWRGRGYGLVMRALEQRPERWSATVALGGLRACVQADYRKP